MNKQLFNRVADIAKENVELSAEKVELGIKDYDAFLDLIVSENTKINRAIGKMSTVVNDLQQLNKTAGQASVDAGNALSKAEAQYKQDIKAARDLGVDASEIKRKFDFVKKQEAALQKLADRMARAASSALKALNK
jgi:hypothetical protein